MSDAPDRPGVANVARALRVERNARRGFALGAVFAALVFLAFAYLPAREHSLWLWLALAFVLAVGTGLLATVALTAVSAVRLARRLDDEGPDGAGR